MSVCQRDGWRQLELQLKPSITISRGRDGSTPLSWCADIHSMREGE